MGESISSPRPVVRIPGSRGPRREGCLTGAGATAGGAAALCRVAVLCESDNADGGAKIC